MSSTPSILAQSSQLEGAEVLGLSSLWGQQQWVHLPLQNEDPGSLSAAHKRSLREGWDDSPFQGREQGGSERIQDKSGWGWDLNLGLEAGGLEAGC